MRGAHWVLQFDGSASEQVGTGGVLIWNAESRVEVAQALWFGQERPTVNVAEMGALEWGMEKLLELGVAGGVLVLGDSSLVIDFCTRRAQPSKPALFRGLRHIMDVRRRLQGRVVFRHVDRGNN